MSSPTQELSEVLKTVQELKDYWNGDTNHDAMHDALCVMEDRLNMMELLVGDILKSSPLDECWISMEDGVLPEPQFDGGGTRFSRSVFVTDGQRVWVDNVLYPHGVPGLDFPAYFSSKPKNKKPIVAWMNIPKLNDKL